MPLCTFELTDFGKLHRQSQKYFSKYHLKGLRGFWFQQVSQIRAGDKSILQSAKFQLLTTDGKTSLPRLMELLVWLSLLLV